MKKTSIYLSLLIIMFLSFPVTAQELKNESYVVDRLVAARAADKIRRNCNSISARFIKAYSEARKLKAWALKRGYSEDQIDRFIKSKPSKKYIYGLADIYLRDKGFNGHNWCEIGKSEIKNKTIAGSLLR